jgi:hypothetical protein
MHYFSKLSPIQSSASASYFYAPEIHGCREMALSRGQKQAMSQFRKPVELVKLDGWGHIIAILQSSARRQSESDASN